MFDANVIETVAAALHAACLRDLPIIEYLDRDWAAHRKWMDAMSNDQKQLVHAKERESGLIQGPTIQRQRRPNKRECFVRVFPQVWGSTALGYGGLGGAAMTTAYTVVVECPAVQSRAVYFGESGRLAYLVSMNGEEDTYRQLLAAENMPSVAEAERIGWITAAASTSNR